MATVTSDITEYIDTTVAFGTLSGLISGAVNASSSSTSSVRYRIDDTAATTQGDIFGENLPVQNGPIDLTTQGPLVLVVENEIGSNRLEDRADDGCFLLLGDASNHFKTFQLVGTDLLNVTIVSIGDGATTNTSGGYESGSLDFSAITTLEIYCTRGSSAAVARVSIYRITTYGTGILTGPSGSSADIESYYSVDSSTPTQLAKTFLQVGSITIGDGGATVTEFDGTQETHEYIEPFSAANFGYTYVGNDGEHTLAFDVGSGDTVTLATFASKGSTRHDFSWNDTGATANTANSSFFSLGAITLQTAYQGPALFVDANSMALQGGTSDSLTIDNVDQLDITNGAGLTNSTFINSTGNGLVITGAPGTYSLGVTFDNNTRDISITPSSAGTFTLNGVKGEGAYTVKFRNESGTHAITVQLNEALSATVDAAGAGLTINQPSITFTASSLTTATFDNIRCRLSLVPGSPVTLNDDGTVANGGINFVTGDVNITNNTITLTGIAGKLNSTSVIRFFGSDLPQPIDSRGVYYPSTDYDDSDSLTISGTPGGPTIDLTDVGSGSDMYGSCWAELDISLVTSGDYSVDLTASASTAGVTLATNDIIVLQAIHHDPAGTGGAANVSNYLEESFLYSGGNITSLSSLSLAALPMSLLTELGLDGSQVTGYSIDASTPSKVQIDVSKTSIDTKELLAFYLYTQWTEAGMRFARGNAIVENLNSIALRGELTFDAAARSVMSGPFTYRLDGENIVAPESMQISFNWENTRAAIVETEVAVDLPSEVLQAIQSILFLTSQIPNISGGSGGGDDAATIYTYFTDSNREDVFKATGFSTHSAADVRTEIDANSTQLAAILADTGTDLPAAISGLNDLSQADIRSAVGLASANIDTQLGDIPTVSEFNARTLASADYFDPVADTVANVTTVGAVTGNVGGVTGVTFPASFNNLSSADVETAATASLNAYDPPTRAELTTDVSSILTQGNSAWTTATGFSTFDPGVASVTVGGYTAGQAPDDLIDLSTLQSNIGLILSYTRPMAKQLGLVSGVTATHSATNIVVSDGDGSTTITDLGGETYRVELT